jgi:hypothetical protein
VAGLDHFSWHPHVDQHQQRLDSEGEERMKTEEMDRIADEHEHKMLRMDGYDDCCIGVMERFGMNAIFCYDVNKIIQRHKDDGMSEEEAWEYFEFNQLGAWVGDGTPCFLYPPEED